MAAEKRAVDSRHFMQIWDQVIRPVSIVVQDECDREFAERCGLRRKDEADWQQALYQRYHACREHLKDVCYGPAGRTGDEKYLLDGRKIASTLCAALIGEKGLVFDSDPAWELTERKKAALSPVEFNRWAVRNIYANYKLAYLVSLQQVYLTLMRDLTAKAQGKDLTEAERADPARAAEEARRLALALKEERHLCPYPPPPKGDGFDVNIVLGLARTDMSRRELDTFLFAMQLYQIEEHTVDILRKRI